MHGYSDELYLQLWQKSLNDATEKQLGNFERPSTRPQAERLRPRVSERDKRIMQLYRQGMSHSRIAQVVGVTRNTVGSAIDRCLRYEQVCGTKIEDVGEESGVISGDILKDLSLSDNNTILYYRNKVVYLTEAEYAAARCILAKEGEFCPIEVMVEDYFSRRPPVKKPKAAMRNAVAGLRHKLDEYDIYVAVRTGVGYKFVYK